MMKISETFKKKTIIAHNYVKLNRFFIFIRVNRRYPSRVSLLLNRAIGYFVREVICVIHY